jgi:hypothetical protein
MEAIQNDWTDCLVSIHDTNSYRREGFALNSVPSSSIHTHIRNFECIDLKMYATGLDIWRIHKLFQQLEARSSVPCPSEVG